jgi:hypothetical protein
MGACNFGRTFLSTVQGSPMENVKIGGFVKIRILTMKSMKIMKNEKFHYNFNFMPFMFFMVQRKDDDITTFYEFIKIKYQMIDAQRAVIYWVPEHRRVRFTHQWKLASTAC